MRLFSEKVVPTFTSSNLNILTVEDFQEIFFDVFEFEINGKKFIAEKVSKYKGLPVVDVPLVLEGKEFTAQFVLQRGKFEVLFNRDNSTFVGEVVEERVESVIEYTDRETEVEEIIFEKKEDILTEIAQARQSAERYIEKLRQQKINEAAQYFDEKKKALDAEIDESKKSLLDEFLSLVESVKGEFFEFNEKEKDKLSTFIEESICELSDQLVGSIEEKQDIAEKRFNKQLDELATNILSGVLLKEINSNNEKSVKDINERFALITSNLKTLLRSERDQIDENVNIKLTEFTDAIVSLEKTNIELNDLINKGDNRALSRIGNVKSQLEEAIDLSTNTLVARVNEAENKIRTFYDNKISLIEEKVEDLTAENKQYFVNLINESKLSLLNEISNIKVDVPNIVVERSNGNQEVDLKGIKSELEKIIGTRFSNELQSLKRLIEMSSGGGSVAKQFAAGGTMNGTLNVTGQILSAGVDLFNIFAGGGGGGGGGDDIAVNTVVRSSSANWNNAFGTVNSLSGGWESAYTYVNANSAIEADQEAVTALVIASSANWNTAYNLLSTLTYENVEAGITYETIQEYAASNPPDINRGSTVELANGRVYVFAGTDVSNPAHYLVVNSNPISPIYAEALLYNNNQAIVDTFYVSDFRSAKYNLQIETNFNNEIYYSEINVVAAVGYAVATANEYGQVFTSELISSYDAEFDVNRVHLVINFSSEPTDLNHKLIVKGQRTNYYKI
jgi:hypothetical protein